MAPFRTILALALIAAMNTACAVFSTEGALTIAQGRLLIGNVLATSGSVTLAPGAKVTGCVFLTSGTLTIQPGAEVWGDVVMTSGAVRALPGAAVRGQVVYTSGTVETAGARVDGGISRDIAGWAASSTLKYCVLPACLLVLLAIGAFFVLARRKALAPATAPVIR